MLRSIVSVGAGLIGAAGGYALPAVASEPLTLGAVGLLLALYMDLRKDVRAIRETCLVRHSPGKDG